MANTFYPKGKEHFANGDVDWEGDTIKIQAIDTASYTYSALHEFLDDIPVGARVGDPVDLANKTATNGILDADDAVLETLTGASIEALICYQDTTVEGTSILLIYWDSGLGLPLTPNGGNVPIVFDNGANKIAKL